MKNQQSAQLVKSSKEIVPSKSAATPSAESGEVVKFDEAGMPQLEVWLEDETIWLTQKQMAELFGCAMENVDRKSTRLNSSHNRASRMPSSA